MSVEQTTGRSWQSKATIVLSIIAVTIAFILALGALRPQAEKRAIPETIVRVDVVKVAPTSYPILVTTSGTVQADTRGDLVAQVRGEIVKESETFRAGGSFSKGELLVEIDPRDYVAELSQASAAVSQADATYRQEQATARQAKNDWDRLGNTGEAPDLVLRKPQLAAAKAQLESASARLETAQLNLERTKVRAPYDGRIIQRNAVLGQYVGLGAPLAEIFSTERVEVRLPLSQTEYSQLGLDAAFSNQTIEDFKVTLRSEVGITSHTWEAVLSRADSTFDLSTRQIDVFARVIDPFSKSSSKQPLKIGQFVNAQIQGQILEQVVVVPNKAIREGSYVFVSVDNKLQRTPVQIAWQDDQNALIEAGLSEGDLVVTTSLNSTLAGATVKLDDEFETEQAAAALPAEQAEQTVFEGFHLSELKRIAKPLMQNVRTRRRGTIMIEWFARNSVAANLLMVGIVIAGTTAAFRSIPMEVFPSFVLDQVSVSTQFRGATPKSVQEGITTRIEEAIADLEGLDDINSRSSEGQSTVFADVASGYDRREILENVKLRVDSLTTLPLAAENPVVSLSARNFGVIYIAVMGDPELGFDDKALRSYADQVRERLLATSAVSLVEFDGVKDLEISIEIDPETLQRYGLSLSDVGQAIRENSIDISAGNIQSRAGDILLRVDGQAFTADDFGRIPVVYDEAGAPIRLRDIARITDGFEEQPLVSIFNGKPVVMLEVLRVGDQSAIKVADAALSVIDQVNRDSPEGISLEYWDDDSVIIRDRLTTLMWSGIQGGFLVLLLLSLFLRPAVAFWVFLGIPVSFMGALIFMPFVGGSFNVMSTFAFITVLGIVVDDAIVTGENIYRKMREGHDSLTASIIGTKQIAVPVTFGILTTVVAFAPLADLGNNRLGILASQIPMVVIPVLLMSLVESKLVLPAHLSHVKPRNTEQRGNVFTRVQMRISRGLEEFVENQYQPFLNKCVNNKVITLTVVLCVSASIMAVALFGHIKYTAWPRVQSEEIRFSLTMPDTTGFETTNGHIERIAGIVEDLQEKYTDPETGVSIIRHVYTTSGVSGRTKKASVGQVAVEIIAPPERHIEITATELANEVRATIGEIPGAQKFSIRAEAGGGGRNPIAIELNGNDFDQINEMVQAIREKLREYPTVYDIQDNFTGGKEELNLELKPLAYSLGLDLADVAEQVSNAVFGFQAQRIQRGRDEVRVMLRYPLIDRSAVDDLNRLPIRVEGSDTPIPLSDLATFKSATSPTTLYRLNRQAVVTVSADLDKELSDMGAIMRDLETYMLELKQSNPQVNYAFRGEAEENQETNSNLVFGLFFIITAIYALLAIPFKSYGQPFIVMSIMPFALVGGVFGHMLFLKDLSFLSVVGMLALMGVVVNDSLVLVDYINQKRKQGYAVMEAVLASGAARFRPVLLTSLTTFAGLTPLLLDTSTQAEFLKPMAISLGFGILFTTLITLIVVPINYIVAHSAKHALLRFWRGVPDTSQKARIS